jgi:hypothetical protein
MEVYPDEIGDRAQLVRNDERGLFVSFYEVINDVSPKL